MVAEVWFDDEPGVLTLHPDVDPQGLPELRVQLQQMIRAGTRVIVVDLSCIDDLPLSVVGALLTAHRACEERGGQVTVRYASRRALDQLRRTGLGCIFHIERPPPLLPAAVRAAGRGHRRSVE
jgi:anti-anti-sigma factor